MKRESPLAINRRAHFIGKGLFALICPHEAGLNGDREGTSSATLFSIRVSKVAAPIR